MLVTAAVSDVRRRRIPNWLVLAGLTGGFAVHGILSGWAGIQFSAAGMGLALLVYFPLYLLRAMGAGDVKLMAACGALAGAANWFGIFLLTGIAGGVMAVAVLLYRGGLASSVMSTARVATYLVQLRVPYVARPELDVNHPKAATLPHGAAIALGGICFLVAMYFWSPRPA